VGAHFPDVSVSIPSTDRTVRVSEPGRGEMHMRIGVIGAGSVGATLARHLARLGYQVSIANSRGPERPGNHGHAKEEDDDE
jgi:phosphoglycerate dehydrogenase-like enzyme